MRTFIDGFAITLFLGLANQLSADIAYISSDGNGRIEMNSGETDFVRENLVHIFDSSNFHQLPGGRLPAKSPKEIEERLKRIQSGPYFELEFAEPTRIIVEDKELRAEKMWVRIDPETGFVLDWILERPDGTLVSLQKARGELIVQFAPLALHLLEKYGTKTGAKDQKSAGGPPTSPEG